MATLCIVCFLPLWLRALLNARLSDLLVDFIYISAISYYSPSKLVKSTHLMVLRIEIFIREFCVGVVCSIGEYFRSPRMCLGMCLQRGISSSRRHKPPESLLLQRIGKIYQQGRTIQEHLSRADYRITASFSINYYISIIHSAICISYCPSSIGAFKISR